MAGPRLGDAEIEAVAAVLRSGGLVQGPVVERLEGQFRELTGRQHAVAVSSGTAALHTALMAAGVGPGDEVVVPAFSFVASANAVLMCGAVPVFADILAEDFSVDPAALERAVSAKTKAVIAVDLFGQCCDFDGVEAVAQQHGLSVIEDAAQAVGAEFRGRAAGSLGTAGCFSMYATKVVTSGEGGVVVLDEEAMAHTARAFRRHGMTGPDQYTRLGYNYRLTDVLAAVGVEQMKRLDELVAARRRNAERLTAGLMGTHGLVVPMAVPGRKHSFAQYVVRVTDEFGMNRDELVAALARDGVETAVHYRTPLPFLPHLNAGPYQPGDFPEAERAAREVLALPVHPGLSRDDVDAVVAAVRAAAN